MTWLKKGDASEAWEIEDEGKTGDLKLASQIREICNSVADSAEAVSATRRDCVALYGPPVPPCGHCECRVEVFVSLRCFSTGQSFRR